MRGEVERVFEVAQYHRGYGIWRPSWPSSAPFGMDLHTNFIALVPGPILEKYLNGSKTMKMNVLNKKKRKKKGEFNSLRCVYGVCGGRRSGKSCV